MRFWYLASPLSHTAEEVRAARYRMACRVVARLMRQGLVVFSPIAHSYPIAKELGDSYHGIESWLELDIDMIRASKGVLFLKAPGWEESKGMAFELELARSLYLPVTEIFPESGELE